MVDQLFRRISILFFLVLLASACSPSEQPVAPSAEDELVPTPEPTATPLPTLTPTPQFTKDWVGTWFIWVGDIYRPIEVVFSADGNQITGIIEEEGGSRNVNAAVSVDGIDAIGEWESSTGNTGPIVMLISEDSQEFAGNLGGELMICGSREGVVRPNPCYTEIGGWNGEWIVWGGPYETEVVLVFNQEGNQLDAMIYDFTGTISDDGRTLTGEFNEFGITGSLEAKLLDNSAQFNGNMVGGMLPFCGVRRGGPKPTECLGP